jgi:hypothetical protein
MEYLSSWMALSTEMLVEWHPELGKNENPPVLNKFVYIYVYTFVKLLQCCCICPWTSAAGQHWILCDPGCYNRLAIYKALYRQIGGFIPDVVAACDQVCCLWTNFLLQRCYDQNSLDLESCWIMSACNWYSCCSLSYMQLCIGKQLLSSS